MCPSLPLRLIIKLIHEGEGELMVTPVSTSGVQNGTAITGTYYVVSEHYPTEYLCQSMWAEPQTRIVFST